MPYYNFNEKKKVKIWEGINGSLFHSQNITCGHIIIDKGTILPKHSHPHEQWTHLVSGELEFDIDGEKMVLCKGITAYVPQNIPHSGRAITECMVIDCFFPVREDFVELENKSKHDPKQ